MVSKPEKAVILQRKFTIAAPQPKVWDLLANAIYYSLPLEKMDIIDEKTFQADLRWKLACFPISLHLKGAFTNVSPPALLGCMLRISRGLMRLSLEVTFTLTQPVTDKTEVICTAAEGDYAARISQISGWVMRRPQRDFATNAFESIRRRLEQLCK